MDLVWNKQIVGLDKVRKIHEIFIFGDGNHQHVLKVSRC
jgi:hypothetical protein